MHPPPPFINHVNQSLAMDHRLLRPLFVDPLPPPPPMNYANESFTTDHHLSRPLFLEPPPPPHELCKWTAHHGPPSFKNTFSEHPPPPPTPQHELCKWTTHHGPPSFKTTSAGLLGGGGGGWKEGFHCMMTVTGCLTLHWLFPMALLNSTLSSLSIHHQTNLKVTSSGGLAMETNFLSWQTLQ